MKNIFSYGSLMYAAVFDPVAGSTARPTLATLKDWSRHRIMSKSYPAAVPAFGAQIEGVLWQDVGQDAVARLDRFEGDEYRRETVVVTKADGLTVDADIYRWLDTTTLEPEDWSREEFEKMHLESFFRIHAS